MADSRAASSEPDSGHASGLNRDEVLEDKAIPRLEGLDNGGKEEDRLTLTEDEGAKGVAKGRDSEDADDGEKDKPEMTELKTHHSNGLVDQTAYLPPRQIIIVFLALTLVIFLSFLDQTIVSTALPNISAAFNAGRNASWVASAYLLTSTAFQPVWGRLSDVFGRKYTLLVCVTVFTIGSLACALARTMTQLIVFRGLQGVGGGGLLTLVLIIVSDIVSLKERGKYQGITEITIAIANGVGPLLGGVLSEKAGWRWCFWINLPIAAITITVIVCFLPLKSVNGNIREKLLQIDYMGSLLTILGAGLIIFPLNWGGISFPWVSGQVIGCLVGGVALFGVLMLWEWKCAKIPIVPPTIFKTSTVNGVMLCTFIAGMVILTQLYYIPQYLQIVRGVSAIRSGVLVLPLLILVTTSVFAAGQLLARTGEYKINVMIGYTLWTVGLGLFSTLDQHTSTAKLIGFMVIGALGQGQTLQTNNTLRSELSQLSGFSSTLIDSIVDDSTGIWRTSPRTGSTLYDLPEVQKAEIIAAFVKGFQTLWKVYIGLMGLNFLIAVFLIKRISLNRADEDALKTKGKAWVEHRRQKGAKGVDVEQGQAPEEGAENQLSKKEAV